MRPCPTCPPPTPRSLLRAARREPTPFTPVWLMRQAGRYLPEYRAMRERHGFLELCRNPEAAAEVTLQPVERFGVDAAILFADILLIVEPLGVGLEFAKGEGPVIHRPVRTEADVARLAPIDVGVERAASCSRRCAVVRRALPPAVAADRLRRRAVHGRLLRRRGRRLARLPAHQAADVRGAGGLAPADGGAGATRPRPT